MQKEEDVLTKYSPYLNYPNIRKGKPLAQGEKNDIIKYDWENKWLKGDEYAHMLNNIEEYCEKFDLKKLGKKTHPTEIYTDPQNGMVYFVEGNSVGSEFGFPRVDLRKRYRWKKMNFTTDLPKKKPYVTYIVASAVKCEKFFPNTKNEGPSFRMHAVILKRDNRIRQGGCDQPIEQRKFFNQFEGKEYILCHLRKIDQNYKISKGNSKRRQLSGKNKHDYLEKRYQSGNKNSCSSGNYKSIKQMNSDEDIYKDDSDEEDQSDQDMSINSNDNISQTSESESNYSVQNKIIEFKEVKANSQIEALIKCQEIEDYYQQQISKAIQEINESNLEKLSIQKTSDNNLSFSTPDKNIGQLVSELPDKSNICVQNNNQYQYQDQQYRQNQQQKQQEKQQQTNEFQINYYSMFNKKIKQI